MLRNLLPSRWWRRICWY